MCAYQLPRKTKVNVEWSSSAHATVPSSTLASRVLVPHFSEMLILLCDEGITKVAMSVRLTIYSLTLPMNNRRFASLPLLPTTIRWARSSSAIANMHSPGFLVLSPRTLYLSYREKTTVNPLALYLLCARCSSHVFIRKYTVISETGHHIVWSFVCINVPHYRMPLIYIFSM